MDEEFVRGRITELRLKKGVSEYKMSLELGHSKGYIQAISSGRAMPSMSEFLYICDYLNITPQEFFEFDSKYPQKLDEIVGNLKKLDDQQLEHISAIIKGLIK